MFGLELGFWNGFRFIMLFWVFWFSVYLMLEGVTIGLATLFRTVIVFITPGCEPEADEEEDDEDDEDDGDDEDDDDVVVVPTGITLLVVCILLIPSITLLLGFMVLVLYKLVGRIMSLILDCTFLITL